MRPEDGGYPCFYSIAKGRNITIHRKICKCSVKLLMIFFLLNVMNDDMMIKYDGDDEMWKNGYKHDNMVNDDNINYQLIIEIFKYLSF